MRRISAKLRRAVVNRAQNRCEYCGLFQIGQEAAFHIDHVVPVASGGPTRLTNLALACVSCSLRKGARNSAVDPISSAVVPIYSPREHDWAEHFRWEESAIVGISPIGRATVAALKLNRPQILEIRVEEQSRGRNPGLSPEVKK